MKSSLNTKETASIVLSLLVVLFTPYFLHFSNKLFNNIIYFLFSFAAIYQIINISSVNSYVTTITKNFAEFLNRRRVFVSNPCNEIPKFAFLRIIFGLFLTVRSFYILVFLFPSDLYSPAILIFAIVNLLAGIFVLLGFLNQIALVYLIVIHWQLGDMVLKTSTLGNDIGAILAILLLITNAGAHLSIDARLRASNSFLGRLIKSTYFLSGVPSFTTIQIAKFVALFSYWSICVYSLMMHLAETAWTSGVAGPLLLTNNFMSKYFDIFVSVFEASTYATYLAKYSLWLMMLWYITIIPFVLLGGFFRKYVIVWGILFFILSTFGLSLGWLGEFEFILWAALFWTSGYIDKQGSFGVLYDDRCNLCDRTVNFLKRVDIFKVIELKPISKNIDWAASVGVSHKDALTDLFGVELNTVSSKYSGYELYIQLSRQIMLLAPLYPVLIVGKTFGIGPKVYRWVAERRTRLFGVCTFPTPKPEHKYIQAGVISDTKLERNVTNTILIHSLILGVFFLSCIPAPFIGWHGIHFGGFLQPVANQLSQSAHIYGIAPINVFNSTDLRMAENWFTLKSVSNDGKETLLPVLRENGSRLDFHKSDRIYFGHTLKWRRKNIDKQGCFFQETRPFLKEVIGLNSRFGKKNSSKYYVYTQYKQLSPLKTELEVGKYHRQTVEVVCREIIVQ